MTWRTSCASAGTKAPNSVGQTSDSLLLKPRSLSSLHFLTSVKREANGALAAVILHDIFSPKASRDPKFWENRLKLAYSCFLRLNCDQSALKKRRIRQSEGVKPVVDALIAVHTRITTDTQDTDRPSCDWSMDGQLSQNLESALKKCREIFPSLSGSFLTKKYHKKKKSGSDSETNKLVGNKRKEADGSYTVVKQFNVEVPKGLTSGETFLTEIKSGEKIKRIRLTVPEGGASNLRFNLRVPVLSDPPMEP
jgi:hypothetical protein